MEIEMQYIVCAVYDKKIASYYPPFYVKHIGQAERWFATQLTGDNDIAKFPADYKLMQVGFFEDETGEHDTMKAGPVEIIDGTTMLGVINRIKQEA